LPPPSYATSAPTAIIRRSGEDGKRLRPWAPWVGAGLLLAALVAGLVLRQPAPPPDLQPSAGPSGSIAGRSTEAQLVTPFNPVPTPADSTTAANDVDPAAATTAEMPATAGQRVEQTPPAVVRPKPVPATAVAAPPVAAAVEAPAVAENAAPAVEAPAPEPPPPIAKTFQCRRGAEFHVDPEEVLVTVDGQLLGEADDWDGAGGGKTYYFDSPGDHLVKLSLQGFRTVWVKVVVTPSAKREVVNVDTELEESE
jgi:hypothetical protein